MKKIFVTGAVLLLGFSGNVFASCLDTQMTDSPPSTPTLTTVITNNTICATQGAEKWQEQHRPGGELWDYKQGPGHPVDPTEKVGTWSIINNQIVHTYGSTSYSYNLHRRTGAGANAFTLCGPLTLDVTILRGQQRCP